MLGILSDTFRFRYDNPLHKETFRIVSELIDAGASIEKLESRLNRYSKPQMQVLAHLAENIIANDEAGFSYSWVYDDFAKKWIEQGNSTEDFKAGCELFVNQFIRNIDQNLWGFIVYQDFSAGDRNYSVSFRSDGGQKDVSAIAKSLGGGGHKPAAGAKFEAAGMMDAINKVLDAIYKG
jgi:phosphoesterase RecJ-like protein